MQEARTADAPAWDAMILAGGRASRLGGIDKTALEWRGTTLMGHAILAAAGAARICVVGPFDPPAPGQLDTRIITAREEPPFAGPASAIVAGLAALDALGEAGSPFVVVLAADLPRVAEAVPLLLAELPGLPLGFDGVMAVDESGRAQTLLAAYRSAPLRRAALAIDGPNRPVRAIVGALRLREVTLPSELCADVDTSADAASLGIPLPAGD